MIAKTLLVVTDVGLLAYWTLTALGLVSVGSDAWLAAWNWSFLPLDLLAVAAGLTWSLLPRGHRWASPALAVALALTHAAGLVALSFFVLWGTWDVSWWIVNLWLAVMPIVLAAGSAIRHRTRVVAPSA
jgi:hypothetical protein